MARRTAADTRAELLAAATTLFHERGFAATSVRDIAAAVGRDAALVIRHFGSKESLFLEAMESEISGGEGAVDPFDGPVEDLGERIIRDLVLGDDRTKPMYLALIRASDGAGVSSRLREVHETAFVAPLRARLSGDDADIRARLAAAMIGGLLYSLWLVEDSELAAHDREDTIRRYGSTLQRILTP